MSTIKTDLGDFYVEAQRVRAQMASGIVHTNVQAALEDIATSPQAIVETPVSASPHTVVAGENFLAVDTSGGAITINLQAALARSGVPLVVKDVSGNASTNNITIVPNGVETIEGLSSLTLNVDFGGVKLSPKSGVGYRISP